MEEIHINNFTLQKTFSLSKYYNKNNKYKTNQKINVQTKSPEVQADGPTAASWRIFTNKLVEEIQASWWFLCLVNIICVSSPVDRCKESDQSMRGGPVLEVERDLTTPGPLSNIQFLFLSFFLSILIARILPI